MFSLGTVNMIIRKVVLRGAGTAHVAAARPRCSVNSFQTTLTPKPYMLLRKETVIIWLLNVLFKCFQVLVQVVW